MNEKLPPPEPESEFPKSSQKKEDYEPPSFGWMLVLGIVLIIVSAWLCIPCQGPAPFYLGALIAFITVFFKGYRGVLIGFVSVIGIILLIFAAICGPMLLGRH